MTDIAPAGVLVLGMHRSGTSAVTRVLNLLGLDAGSGVLMGAAPSNPTGHWEVADLTAVNDGILDQLGGRWAAPPPATAAQQVVLAEGVMGQQAAGALAEVFASPPWVWKDPRVSLLLPFWRHTLGDDTPIRAVVVVRAAAEVAASLRARDGMADEYGLALWERYNRAILDGVDGLAVTVVRYDDLLADPTGTAALLLEHAAGASSELTDEQAAAVEGYLDGGHRHQDGSRVAPLTAEQQHLEEHLDALIGPHPEGLDASGTGPESPGLQMAFDEHKRLSRFEEVANQYNADQTEIERLQAEVALLKDDLQARSEQATDLADRLVELQQMLDDARAEGREWEEKLLEIYATPPYRVYARMRRLLGRVD